MAEGAVGVRLQKEKGLPGSWRLIGAVEGGGSDYFVQTACHGVPRGISRKRDRTGALEKTGLTSLALQNSNWKPSAEKVMA